MRNAPERPRVVILGGGFGGLGAALELGKSDVDVVLFDRNDFHTFQPLLYQLATGLLEPSAVGHSLRDLVHEHDNVTIHKTPVTGVDLEARTVTLAEMVWGSGMSAGWIGVGPIFSGFTGWGPSIADQP